VKDSIMLLAMSAINGFAVAAEGGKIGKVSDFLFDDRTWKLRWMVVDTGHWLTGRKVLVHPSAIGPVNYEREHLTVRLTKQQVENSPDILDDEPVSRHMQDSLYGYYGWDPLWGGGNYLGGYTYGLGFAMGATRPYDEGAVLEADRAELRLNDADPHLRSVSAVTGYHIQATDGSIGHIQNMMVETDNWGIRYLVVDTRNWWPGKRVLLSPYAVKTISWADRDAVVDVSREQVKASPAWQPEEAIDRAYEERLHGYYGWPGYGW
jgi:sporulation protein YlmC with PRC-barrel domain